MGVFGSAGGSGLWGAWGQLWFWCGMARCGGGEVQFGGGTVRWAVILGCHCMEFWDFPDIF